LYGLAAALAALGCPGETVVVDDGRVADQGDMLPSADHSGDLNRDGKTTPDGGVATLSLKTIETVSSHIATFASHAQKVVQTADGIFATYTVVLNEAQGHKWRLSRSEDSGETWTPLYTGHGAQGPVMVVDNTGNLILFVPNMNNDDAYLFVFRRDKQFQSPTGFTLKDIPCDAKFDMVYDPNWNVVHVGTQYGRFLTLNPSNGKAFHDYAVYASVGKTGKTQYPHVAIDRHKNIHFAMTSADKNDPTSRLYRTIQHVYATPTSDGKLSWRRMGGALLTLPVAPDETGSSTMINDQSEIAVSSHLSSFLAKGDKVHFYYVVEKAKKLYAHYKRFDFASGLADVDISTAVKPLAGQSLSLGPGGAGYLGTEAIADGTSALYLTAGDVAGGVSSLISHDNGMTWQDFATTGVSEATYAIGTPTIIKGGKLIGVYTSGSSGTYPVRFFRAPF
jgi:hypothetical protein